MKVKSIRRIKLDKEIPVYDITVPMTENFCLSSGIVIHNSKDVADAVCGVVHNIVAKSDSYGVIKAVVV